MMNDTQNEATMETTHTIAGYSFTLTTGENYVATRPMAHRRGQRFAVSIRKAGSDYTNGRPVAKVRSLTYDAANDLLTAFNNGDSSWDGRVW